MVAKRRHSLKVFRRDAHNSASIQDLSANIAERRKSAASSTQVNESKVAGPNTLEIISAPFFSTIGLGE